MMGSCTAMPSGVAIWTIALVMWISACDGVGSPEGWLCRKPSAVLTAGWHCLRPSSSNFRRRRGALVPFFHFAKDAPGGGRKEDRQCELGWKDRRDRRQQPFQSRCRCCASRGRLNASQQGGHQRATDTNRRLLAVQQMADRHSERAVHLAQRGLAILEEHGVQQLDHLLQLIGGWRTADRGRRSRVGGGPLDDGKKPLNEPNRISWLRHGRRGHGRRGPDRLLQISEPLDDLQQRIGGLCLIDSLLRFHRDGCDRGSIRKAGIHQTVLLLKL